NQDPDEIGKRVAEFIEGLAPAGTSIGVNIRTGSGRAIRTSPHSRSARILSQAVADVFGKPCSFIFGGGSIPITEKLQRITHAETILMGLGLDSDNIHAPNEHFGWNRIALGMQVIVRATEIFSAPPIQEDVL
ncbi:MAG: M20/M25/M40 family metallo-hydrolase, partial [Chlamydiia bacterium]|nr:M20/M25/M40 family metallo-hydrolase [Chlamydiia bacterium]